ncbi:MAG: hypothetical protein HOV77_27050 [Hamadaea sp.]|uniref:hypothetical protein n=1 Tax=Hamadaea sp. TaxID=2024425 RepID=UPI0017D502CF|nr:hypothetical protein [Hamadaea sp.]NUT22842.1 hypothetical protein [Hamadaea sp.]
MSLATDVPIAPAERRRPWAFALFCLALLGLAICGTGLWIGVPIAREYPATITIPDTVLGLPRSTDSFHLDIPADAVGQIAIYGHPDKLPVVVVVAGAGFTLRPDHDVRRLLAEVGAAYDEMGSVTEVPAGDLGGVAKCAYVRDKEWSGHRGVMCGWADHGSVGIVTFVPADDLQVAGREMVDVRSAVESR